MTDFKKFEIHRPGIPFEILSNPEFLAEGTAVKDLLSPDRVIIGSADTESGRKAAETLASVYATWVPRSRITTINVWSSELSKLVANAMLAQRISSINSISAICEKTGADISEIALCIGLDPRIGPKFLKSGVGFGGSCFKKDILSLIYLARSLGLPEVGDYWQQVLTLNDFQRDRFARRVITRLNNTLVRKKVTLLGFAFKNNTSDTREAPSVDVIKTLLADGPGEIAIFDPCCDPAMVKAEVQRLLGSKEEKLLREDGGPVEVYTDAYEACRDSNAVVILTEWDEFRNSPVPAMTKSIHKSRHAKPKSADPRPFLSAEPSESDLLALHKFLSSHPHSSLDRYVSEPDCVEDCKDCVGIGAAYSKVGEQLDWGRLAVSLKEPKWVFDGRGIMDITGLEKLGIRAEAVGRAPPAKVAR
jgi:UDPglucose 6-dehydrogenase